MVGRSKAIYPAGMNDSSTEPSQSSLSSASEVFPRLVQMVSRLMSDRRRRRAEFVFTAGVIALAAKMAKADGVVLRAEVDAFREICEVPADEHENVSRLFNLAKGSVAGFEAYADQLGRHFGDAPDVLEDVLEGLFYIAKADGALHEGEVAYLEAVATRFGIADRYPPLLARHVHQSSSGPHAILGTHAGMERGALRKRYRELIARHHPDRLIAEGVPEPFLKLANDRLSAINAAYADVMAETAADTKRATG